MGETLLHALPFANFEPHAGRSLALLLTAQIVRDVASTIDRGACWLLTLSEEVRVIQRTEMGCISVRGGVCYPLRQHKVLVYGLRESNDL